MSGSVDLPVLSSIADLAEEQSGFLTAEQVLAGGYPEAVVIELLEAGVLEPAVVPGVLRLRGGASHPLPRIYGLWLRLQPATPATDRDAASAGVLAGGTAVRLYGVLAGLPGPELDVLVSLTADLPATPPEGLGDAAAAGQVRVRRADLATSEWQMVHGLPVTSPAWTLVDLADGGPVDLMDLARIAGRFVHQGWATREDLLAGVAPLLQQRQISDQPARWLAQFLPDSPLVDEPDFSVR